MKISLLVGAALVIGSSSATVEVDLRAKKAARDERKLQRENILSYNPMNQVTDVAAIDLDQIALESMLPIGTADAMSQAMDVYTNGGFSGSYARLTLAAPISPAIDFNLTEGTIITGESFEGGKEVRGVLMESITGGDTEVLVRYETKDSQRDYVGCQVGGSPNPILEGCFATTGDIVVGNPQDVLTFNFEYSYDVLTDNQNYRTLQGFSTSAKEDMYDCTNCPYEAYQKFYNYYGKHDYGDEWILAAFNRASTNFQNGNADFSGFGDNDRDGIVEAIKKGTVFFNVYMEVINSMEEACDKCEAREDSRVQSWDEAVALYVGSMAKVTNGNDGNFLYTNAKKRCRNFGTCAPAARQQGGNGEAKVNQEIFDQFSLAQRHVFLGECDEARSAKNRISDLMAVPLIQGTLRFAYLMDQEGIIDSRSDITSATYAASVLPLVQSCSPVDAQIIYSNMKIGATSVSFADVKAAFERNYKCMGLSCVDVGGLLSNRGYINGAEPCDDATLISNEPLSPPVDAPQDDAQLDTTQAVEGETVDVQTVNATSIPETASPTSEPMETAENLTDIPIVMTEAPTPAMEEIPDSETQTTPPSVEVFAPVPLGKCPPCKEPSVEDTVSTVKSLSDCPILLEQQKDAIGAGCECACFVDSEFAFCAKESISYTGSGSLVGPCEVELPDSLIEEADTGVEDFTQPPEDEYPPLADAPDTNSSPNTTITETDGTSANVDSGPDEQDGNSNEVPDVNPSDFNIAAAESQSSAGLTVLSGLVAFAITIPHAVALL